MVVVPRVAFIFLLILINSFFVAAEIALVTIRRTRVEELIKKGNPTAKLLKQALESLDIYISATQLGVTIVSLLIGWLIGEPLVADKLQKFLSFLPAGLAFFISHSLTIATTFLLITYIQIVLGELVPKTIALQKTETTAQVIIGPLLVFTNIFKPFIKILNISARFVLKLLHFPSDTNSGLTYTKDEVKVILDQLGKSGKTPRGEVDMVQNVFKLSDMPINEIMIPRPDIVGFKTDTSLEKVFEQIRNNTFSRYPVYTRSIDNINGFIHVKDVYQTMLNTDKNQKLSQTKLVRKILCVPETKKVNDVLLDMKSKHIHLALVNDEFGQTAGIVTLEDIIECVIGQIQDEFDKQIKDMQRMVDGSYLINGSTSLDLVQKMFRLSFKRQAFTTIGGLVFGLLGRAPKIGDKINLNNWIFAIEGIKGKRIEKIRVKRNRLDKK